jgi:hypothetical protein
MNKFCLLVLGIFLAACQPTTPAGPPTVTVSSLADSGAGSLRETLSSAEAGSVVSLKNLTGTLTLASELVINKNLTLEGSGVVISGDGKTRVLNVAAGSNVTLKGLKLSNGKNLAATSAGLAARAAIAGQGGIIFNAGTLVLQAGTEISGGEASLGGGIYNAGTLTLEGGVIKGNKAVGTATGQGRGGGVFNEKGATFTISSGTIQSNSSEINSGGVETAGTLTMSGGSVENNTTAISGGGISIVYGGSFTLTGGTIKNNSSTRDATMVGDNFGGGGVNNNGTFKMQGGTISGNKNKYGAGVVNFDQGNGATFEFSGGTIVNNSTLGIGSGGGIATFGGNFVMTNGVVQNNTTSKEGAGIVIGGNAEISGGEIKSNTASSGAGLSIYKNGKLTLKGGTIQGNTATDSGGGISVAGTVTMTGGTVSNNTATVNGGGVFTSIDGTFTNNGGTVTGNTPNDTFPTSTPKIHVKITASGHQEISQTDAYDCAEPPSIPSCSYSTTYASTVDVSYDCTYNYIQTEIPTPSCLISMKSLLNEKRNLNSVTIYDPDYSIQLDQVTKINVVTSTTRSDSGLSVGKNGAGMTWLIFTGISDAKGITNLVVTYNCTSLKSPCPPLANSSSTTPYEHEFSILLGASTTDDLKIPGTYGGKLSQTANGDNSGSWSAQVTLE